MDDKDRITFKVHDANQEYDEYGKHYPEGFEKKLDCVEVLFDDKFIGTIFRPIGADFWSASLCNSEFVKKGEAKHLAFKNKDLEECKKDIKADVALIINVFDL